MDCEGKVLTYYNDLRWHKEDAFSFTLRLFTLQQGNLEYIPDGYEPRSPSGLEISAPVAFNAYNKALFSSLWYFQ
jgi:hypothetical protein